MSTLSAGSISWIVLTGGGGSLLRHRFTITHVTLRRKEIGISGLIKLNRGLTTPNSMTRSRNTGPSPMMFPSAHTACSQTFSCGDMRSCRKTGTAPACTTLLVCADVPDAMLVRAHAVSNCRITINYLWLNNSTSSSLGPVRDAMRYSKTQSTLGSRADISNIYIMQQSSNNYFKNQLLCFCLEYNTKFLITIKWLDGDQRRIQGEIKSINWSFYVKCWD